MILVLAISDFAWETLLRFGGNPREYPRGLSDMNSTGARQEEQENTEVMNTDELGEYIASKSCAFVQAAFERDKSKVEDMLCTGTIYVISEDNSVI